MTHFGRIRMFQTTDALEDMLHQTDFGDDIPASWFQPPFTDIYIEFGEGRHFPLTMSDPQSGRHIIEGCYLLSGRSRPLGSQGPLVRGFDMIIFGSPAGKSGIMDDCFVHMGLPIESESAPISEVVRRVVDHYAARADFPNADIFRPVVEHVAKVLVYLGTREARQREVRDGKAAKLRLAGLKSTAKREKASRQAARLYDRIVVGPDALPAELSKGAPGRSGMKAHIRRGHFRSQAYGPQHSLRRPQWLQPTLVGQSQLAANGTQAAYEIR